MRSLLSILPLLLLGLSTPAYPDDLAAPEASDEEPLFLYRENREQGIDYETAVAALLESWEKANTPLAPGETGRVVLKVYTNSGLGLRTPLALVSALADELVARGFQREDILIADLDKRRLRNSGYLPPISKGGETFDGMRVIALNEPERFLENWFYDSPLPPDSLRDAPGDSPRTLDLLEGDEDRKSYLPTPLLFDLDFWINLPVAVEHPVLGLSGATANAGLWAVSNQSRFFTRPISAASSAVEIASIPELVRTWKFSILSLETYQIIGGPRFNSLYTEGKSELLLSSDPLLLDRYALSTVNQSRLARNFDPIRPEPLFLRYGESLGLGDSTLKRERIEVVAPGDP